MLSRTALTGLLIAHCGLAFGQDTPAMPPEARAGQTMIEALVTKGALTHDEMVIIESAAELNPRLLQGAAVRAHAAGDPEGVVARATQKELAEIRADLLNRASLQAVASGTVPVERPLQERVEPYLGRVSSADLPMVALPEKVREEAFWSLANRLLILRPLCPIGMSPTSPLAKGCIGGDPWSAKHFQSVVPILVNGVHVCTGTVLEGGVVLTAAHCVVKQTGGNRFVVDAAAVRILDGQNRSLPLQEQPRVPDEMMPNCLPECPDLSYDFALLQLDPAAAAAFTPIPILAVLPGIGDFPITIAGYGVSTMPAGAGTHDIQIGAQRLKVDSIEQPLQWSYSAAMNSTSSFCSGDSGGPVFQGSPRREGDSLTLVGVISRFVSDSGTCFEAKATAINLTQAGPRSTLCNMLGHAPSYCSAH